MADPVQAGSGDHAESPVSIAGPSRMRRLLGGWSANLIQVILGITQQLALVPIFLHFCSSDMLAAWLAIYAASNLTLIADVGLLSRNTNRFLAFKSGVDSDGRSAQFFARMQRVYAGLLHQHYVLGEVPRAGAGHCVTTVFHNDGLLVVFEDVR